jgi:hypothetical protein
MPIISSISGNFSPIGRSRKPFNLATGGNTVVDVTNYNGTGKIWRVHTFTSGAGTFNVLSALDTFRWIIIAGGGYGGGDRGGGGGGGGVIFNDSATLTTGTYNFSVGAAQGSTTAFGQTCVAGGTGGSYLSGGGSSGGSGGGGGGPSGPGGAGTSGQGNNGAGGGGFGGGYGGSWGSSSNITGTAISYSTGGASGDFQSPNATPTIFGYGGFGGRNNPDQLGRTNGAPGAVIVAYQIG